MCPRSAQLGQDLMVRILSKWYQAIVLEAMKKKTQSYVIFFCCFGSVEQKIGLCKRFHNL